MFDGSYFFAGRGVKMKGALILSVVMLSGCAIPSPMKFKDAAEKLSLARTGRSNDIIDGGSLRLKI